MPVSTKQLTICDFSSDFEKFFNQNQTNLLTLLDKFIDISSYIPHSFYKSYYRQFGRDRKYSLESMISFFILKNILCISSIDTMINILSLSSWVGRDTRALDKNLWIVWEKSKWEFK